MPQKDSSASHSSFCKNCDHPCVCHYTRALSTSPTDPSQNNCQFRLNQIQMISKLTRTLPEPRVSWGPRSECALHCRATPEAHQAKTGISLLGMETAEATKAGS